MLGLIKNIFWIPIYNRKINAMRDRSKNTLKIIFSSSSNVVFFLKKGTIISLNMVDLVFVSSHQQRYMEKGIVSISKLQPLNSRLLP